MPLSQSFTLLDHILLDPDPSVYFLLLTSVQMYRDILNHVYFDKKLLYLAALAEILNVAGLCSTIQVSTLHGDPRKPYLLLKPNGLKSKFSVRVFPCIPSSVFKLSQLKSTKNNVRPAAWMVALQSKRRSSSSSSLSSSRATTTAAGSEFDPSTLPPTPFYNMTILEDIAVIPQFRILSKAKDSCACFKDVCILLKVLLHDFALTSCSFVIVYTPKILIYPLWCTYFCCDVHGSDSLLL